MNRPPCLVGLFLAACCLCQFGGASTKPAVTTGPVKPLSDLEAARAEARKDLAAGVLGYRLPVPEAFLLEWEDRESEDKDLLEYNGALLADRYGIRFDWVMFHAASPRERAKAVAYNEEMIPAIVTKFGSDVTDKTWKEACNASPATRAKYLAARREAAQAARGPSTRPATQPSPPARPGTRASDTRSG
jgi:hypothetical protein